MPECSACGRGFNSSTAPVGLFSGGYQGNAPVAGPATHPAAAGQENSQLFIGNLQNQFFDLYSHFVSSSFSSVKSLLIRNGSRLGTVNFR
jgi:hypothetical protein